MISLQLTITGMAESISDYYRRDKGDIEKGSKPKQEKVKHFPEFP